MKRTLSVILVAVTGFCCFMSCAQTRSEETSEATQTEQVTTEQGSQAETVETEVPYIESLGAKDFDGAAYSILAVPQGDLPVHAEELTGEGVNDAIFERDAAVSDAYNIVIEYPGTTATPNNAINVTNSVMAGDTCYDLYLDALSDGKNYMSHAFRNGDLYNLIDVPYLSLDQAWWSELMYDKLQYKGKMYFTSGDIAAASYYAPSCVFMNLAVLKNHNLDENEIYIGLLPLRSARSRRTARIPSDHRREKQDAVGSRAEEQRGRGQRSHVLR